MALVKIDNIIIKDSTSLFKDPINIKISFNVLGACTKGKLIRSTYNGDLRGQCR